MLQAAQGLTCGSLPGMACLVMKKRSFFAPIRSGGVLGWSTACILAGGMVGLTGCERKYVATAQDENMAKLQAKIDALDAQKGKLMNGEVENNFNLPGVGYYHAEACDFFEHPYGYQQDGRWFANGKWQDHAVAETPVTASRPTVEALTRVEAALNREQQLLASQGKSAPGTAGSSAPGTAGGSAPGTTGNNHQGGPGVGTALMMYWLLAGNRGSYAPGMGFQRAGAQVDTWQRGVDDQRRSVSAHAAANPGYSRMVAQSHSTGAAVKAGQSVRGGFGSSSSPSAS